MTAPIDSVISRRRLSSEKRFEAKKKDFKNVFVSGANLRRIPERFEDRFYDALKNCNIVDVAGSNTTANAIDDLGSYRPRQSRGSATRYARDPKIRAAALKRAQGKCEYCLEAGFTCDDEEPYLESRHIIALANDGKDRMENVVALCANDRRQAHFGKDWKEIEQKMIDIVKGLEARRRL